MQGGSVRLFLCLLFRLFLCPFLPVFVLVEVKDQTEKTTRQREDSVGMYLLHVLRRFVVSCVGAERENIMLALLTHFCNLFI